MDTPRLLLEHYLKQLRLPTMMREFPKLGEQCAKEGATFEQFLLRLVEQEMMDRERRATERRIHAARFPVSKSLETYDFLSIPSLNKKLVVELARCEWIGRRENVAISMVWISRMLFGIPLIVFSLFRLRTKQEGIIPGGGLLPAPSRFGSHAPALASPKPLRSP